MHVQIQIQIHETGLLVSKPGLLMVQSQSQSHSHTGLGLGRRPIVGVKTFSLSKKDLTALFIARTIYSAPWHSRGYVFSAIFQTWNLSQMSQMAFV